MIMSAEISCYICLGDVGLGRMVFLDCLLYLYGLVLSLDRWFAGWLLQQLERGEAR